MTKKFFHNVAGVYIILFILSFTIPHQILPNFGYVLKLPFEYLAQHIYEFFGGEQDILEVIESDTTLLYIHLLQLIPISGVVGYILLGLKLNISITLLSNIVAYYLAAILFIYGFDKVFKHQFFLPEPNIMYTPFGELTKDIAFWSIMGASKSYTVFSGIIELIPAVLLCFKRTRAIGALIAFMVLGNVLMLNVSFNISVKMFTILLLLMVLYLLLIDSSVLKKMLHIKSSKFYQKASPLQNRLSVVGMLILMLNGSFTFIKYGHFNDDNIPRLPFHGAYQTNNEGFDKVFIHRMGYFIAKPHKGDATAIPFTINHQSRELILADDFLGTDVLPYQAKDNVLEKIIISDSLVFVLTELPYEELPMLENSFNWYISN